MEILIKLGIFLVLAVVGYWRGSKNERAHLKWIADEEQKLSDVLVFATRYPSHVARAMDPILVSGSVVVGSDFFRLLVAGLRKVVGGNYRSYAKLMDRGRRHALIKLKMQAREKGARMVFNVRYTASTISNSRAGDAAQMEILAYGTAYVPAAGSVAQSRVHYQPNPHITEHDGATDLMKNPASRWWVLGWFAGVAYCVGELFTDSLWPHAWRYVSGAPWMLFGVLALGVTAWLVANGRKHKLGWGESLILGLLTLPLLACVLYFGALRVNGATAFGVASTSYVLQKDFSLRPAQPDSAKPVLRFGDYMDYWASQKPGSQADVIVVRGWLGFYQYDLNSLRDRYRTYYQGR